MGIYIYTARKIGGAVSRGVVRAATKEHARNGLQGRGLAVTSLAYIALSPARWFSLKRRFSARELSLAVRQLASLLSADISVVAALRVLHRQQRSGSFRSGLRNVSEEVAAGMDLSEAFRNRTAEFGPLLPAVTKAGETAGMLPDLLRLAAANMMAEDRLRRRVRGALIYPMFVFLAVAVAVVLFSVYVVPTFAEVFEEAEQSLPAITRLVMQFGVFVSSFWPVLLLLPLLVFLIARIWKHGRERWNQIRSQLVLRLPVWGRVEQNVAMAEFTRSLGTLVSCNVQLLHALELSAGIIHNPEIRGQILSIRVSLASGGSMSELLSGLSHIDPFVVETVETGERTGSLGTLLLQAAEFYESEVEIGMQALTSLLEPVIISVVAVLVTIVAFAMYLPLFDLVRTARVG